MMFRSLARSTILLALAAAFCTTASAATDVWLFRGAGFEGWSAGIDQIARRVRTLRGVATVHVSDFRSTQAAYDFLRTTPHEHPILLIGYSCGGNASLTTGAALSGRAVHVIMLQPSIWCGRYPTTGNMHYVQSSWSPGTLGLGSYQPEGPPAAYTRFIERHEPHLDADTDELYQRDATFAAGAVADPSRRWLLERHIRRTAPYIDRQDATVIWRRE